MPAEDPTTPPVDDAPAPSRRRLADVVAADRPRPARRPVPRRGRAAGGPPVRGGAQPRARARRGRVAHPPHLAPRGARCADAVRRGARPPAPGGPGLRRAHRRRARRDREDHGARRQGRGVPAQGAPGRGARGAGRGHRAAPGVRAGALRVHERGHQQPRLRADGAGRGATRLAARRPGAGRPGRGDGARARRGADAGAHARPAGDAHHAGQGARGARPPAAPPAAPGRGAPSTWARSTVRPAPTARTWRPCRARTGWRCRGRSSSTWA